MFLLASVKANKRVSRGRIHTCIFTQFVINETNKELVFGKEKKNVLKKLLSLPCELNFNLEQLTSGQFDMKVTVFFFYFTLLFYLLFCSFVSSLRCFSCKSVNLDNKRCEKITNKQENYIKNLCSYKLLNGTKIIGDTCVALRTVSCKYFFL